MDESAGKIIKFADVLRGALGLNKVSGGTNAGQQAASQAELESWFGGAGTPHNVYTVEGKDIRPQDVSQESWSALTQSAQYQRPVYYSNDAKTEFTTDFNKANFKSLNETSIEFDKDNNQIKIKAPEAVLKSEAFKQTFNSDQFKQLSKAYMANPNAELTLNDGTTKTVNSLMDSYRQSLSTQAEYRPQLDYEAKRQESLYGVTGLSDSQLLTAMGGANQKSDANKDVVYLPQKVIGGYDFSKLESFNEGDQGMTISVGDFDKFNQSKAFDDEHLKKARQEAKDVISEFAKLKDKDVEYIDTDKDALVRWQNFYNSLYSRQAKVTAPVQVANFVEGTVQATGQVILDLADDLGGLMKGPNLDVSLAEMVLTPQVYAAGVSLQTLSALGNMFDNIMTNPNMDGKDAFKVFVTDLGDITGFGVSDDQRAYTNEVLARYEKNIAARQDVAGSYVAGQAVGTLVGEIIKQEILIKPIGKAGGKLVSGTIRNTPKMVAGLKALTKAAAGVKDVKILTNLAKTSLELSRTAVNISDKTNRAATVLGTFADVATQSIAETIINDSQALQEMYNGGGESATIANDLVNSVFWNTIGELGGFGSSKIVEEIGETVLGRGVKLISGKVVNKVAARKTQAKLAVQKLLSRVKGLGDDLGAGTRDYQSLLVDLQKRIGKASSLEELDALTKERIDLENTFDNFQSMGKRTAAKIVSTPLIKKPWDDFQTSATNLSTAIARVGDDLMPNSKVSQEVANYLSIKMQFSRASADPKTAGSKWANALEERLTRLSDSLSKKGLLDLADDNYNALARMNRVLIDYEVGARLLRASDIESLRATGYWGSSDDVTFFHTKRIKTKLGESAEKSATTALEEYENGLNQNSVRKFHAQEAEIYQLSKTDIEGDFLDPNMVLMSEFYGAALNITRRDWGNALLNASGVSKRIGGVEELKDASKAVKNLNTFQTRIYNNVRKSFGETEQLSLDELFPQAKRIKTQSEQELAQLAKDRTAATRAYNRATDTYAGMQLSVNDLNEIEVKLSGDFDIPNFDPAQMRAADFQELTDSIPKTTRSLMQKQVDKVLGAGTKLNLTNYRTAYRTIEDMDLGLRRSYITNNRKIKNTKGYKDVIRRVKKENDDFRNVAFLDKYQSRYDDIVARYSNLKSNPFGLSDDGKNFKAEVGNMVEGVRKEWISRIKETEDGRKLIEIMTDEGLDEDTAVQYLVVGTLDRVRLDGGSNPIRESVLNYLNENGVAKESRIYGDISSNDKQEFADIVSGMADDIIESEWNTMTRSLIDNGYSNLVDLDKVFDRVKIYADDVLGELKDNRRNIIEILDEEGRLQYVETSPVVKDLYEWKPNYADSAPSAFFLNTNRLFKMFTSGIGSIKSLFTQGVKDPINTYVAGGAMPFMNRGMSRLLGGDAYGKVSDSIVESLQDKVVPALREEFGEEGWAIFRTQAAEQGMSVERAAVEYELITRPQAIVGVGGTEAKFYQEIANARRVQNAYEYNGALSGDKKAKKFKSAFENALSKAEDLSPANARETYLRNIVYGAQYEQALGNGKSVAEARAIAERFMADATTNFSRPLAMGNRIARSIPYLSAAFNGKASFFRLLEIDPTGVGGRFMGGLVLPYMSLLGESLGRSENREVYKNIPESDKAGNLVFVFNGVALKIPIPEELSVYIAPFRQAIEKAAGANDHSWAELLANDLLQLPALDLTGFYDIDQNELLNNPSFWGRMGRGFEKLVFGQMAPAIVKSTYMAITGRDPYYGTKIDWSNMYDNGDGTVQVMDSNDNKIATAVSGWAKNFGISLSPSAAYSVIGAALGKGLLNLGDSLISLLSGEPTGIGESTVKGVSETFLEQVPDRGAQEWKELVRLSYDRKSALMNSEKYEKYVQAINNTQLPEEKRQEYISNWRTYTQDYTNQLLNAANTMKEKYGLTVSQQASLISLFTFADNNTPAFTGPARDKSQDLFYNARSVALETLSKLGFQGTSDLSIFGYGTYVKNRGTGKLEYKYKYNSPMDILDMSNVLWGQAEITLGNIKTLVEGESGIKDDWDVFREERDKLYDQASAEKDKKKRKTIYDQIDNMKEQWSNRVMRAIVPYVDNYGLDGLLNNREVISYLEKYIQVPSNLMGDAKYMSQSKTGLDKNTGFAQSYIKKWYELYKKEQQKGNK